MKSDCMTWLGFVQATTWETIKTLTYYFAIGCDWQFVQMKKWFSGWPAASTHVKP